MNYPPRHQRLAVLMLAVTLIAAACANSSEDTSTDDNAATATVAETSVSDTVSLPDTVEAASTEFSISSSVITDGGELPAEFTCDGSLISPPIEWTDAPGGTTNIAVLMDHQPSPDEDYHWYWTLWGIDPSATGLAAGSNGDATVGTNSTNDQQEYAPPCSQGPGEKAYTITVFALSEDPSLADPTAVDRDALLSAIDGITVASDSMTITYTRS